MVLKSFLPDVVIPEIPLGQYVMSALQSHDGDSIAIIEMLSGASMTFKELQENVLVLAKCLWKAGLRKGDIVALVLPFGMEYAPLFVAISYCGAVLFGCKLLFKSSIKNQLAGVKPVLVITTSDRLNEISADVKEHVPSVKLCLSFDQLQNIQPGSLRNVEFELPCYGAIDVHNDPAVIFQSSGTTGEPKGIVSTHYAMVALLTATKTTLKLYPDDVLGCNLTILHAQSLNMFLTCATQGVTAAYANEMTAEQHLEFISKYSITCLGMGNVSFLKKIVDQKNLENYDLSSLTAIIVGGTNFPPELIAQARKKFGVVVAMGYGMTEAGYISVGFSNKTPTDSVGRLGCNLILKVVDVQDGKELGCGQKGEICVKGSQIMKEYLIKKGPSPQTIDDGWLHSGDLGYYDKKGYLYIVGRIKDAIKVQPGNVTVMPAELEDVLIRHDLVTDVAVVAVPHPEFGEAPKAFVVTKKKLEKSEIIQFFNSQVENVTSLHGGVEFVESIPRNETGKPLRRELLQKTSN